MDELVGGSAAQGKAAEYERTGLISDGLLAILPLLTNKLDGLKLFEPAFRDANYGEAGHRGLRAKPVPP